MLVIFLDWSGTIFIIIGSIIFTSRKASKPKIRLFALSFYLLSNIFWSPFAIILETYGLLVTQIILFVINIRGIIICLIEIRKVKTKVSEKVLEEMEWLSHSYSSDTIIINEKIIMDKNHFESLKHFIKIINWEEK